MRWIGRLWARYPALRYQVRAVFWGPLIVGAAAGLFFAYVPQSREVYLGIIEDPFAGGAVFQGLLGLALIGLLCGLLDAWQHVLCTNAIDRMYLEHADIYVDRRLFWLRDWLCRIAAVLPLAGLVIGLTRLIIDAQGAAQNFSRALTDFGGKKWSDQFPEFAHTFASLPYFPLYVAATMLILGVPSLLLMRYARARRDRMLISSFSVRRLVLVAGSAIALAAVIVPLLAKDYVVAMTQTAGPLASAAIALIVLVTLLTGLSYLSTILRVPIMGAAVFGLFAWMVWTTIGILTPKAAEAPRVPTRAAAHDKKVLTDMFDKWLAQRQAADGESFKRAGVGYPVFIVSAQGGGIYAAAGTSAFLASMQDPCENFAQHVFAISGVSGGAVGAALFAASLPDALTREARCDPDRPKALTERTRDIVRQDHLSPALALIWPDIARKLSPWHDATFDRSAVLERSFACAFDRPEPWYLCPAANGGKGLRIAFQDHWRPDRPAPALILTGTWVETGFRTAFAPFPLHAVSDGTLESFYRGADGNGDFKYQGVDLEAPRSLIEAAFVSARFPGIVPAWQRTATLTESNASRTWNFVDGGYVDNSGATTALELYQVLAQHAKERKLGVDLYLVMLTDANTSADLSEVENGTRFSDLVAPITALLSVRGQLAFRAVTRAIDELEPNAAPERLAGMLPGSKVLAVNLQQTTFELPLGWKISRITDDIVRLMLGRPDLCGTLLPGTSGNNDIVRVIRDNSCVKRRIESLLSARGNSS
jgi:hypothetical protein